MSTCSCHPCSIMILFMYFFVLPSLLHSTIYLIDFYTCWKLKRVKLKHPTSCRNCYPRKCPTVRHLGRMPLMPLPFLVHIWLDLNKAHNIIWYALSMETNNIESLHRDIAFVTRAWCCTSVFCFTVCHHTLTVMLAKWCCSLCAGS